MLLEEVHVFVILGIVEVADLNWKELREDHLWNEQKRTDKELELELSDDSIEQDEDQSVGEHAHVVEQCVGLVERWLAGQNRKYPNNRADNWAKRIHKEEQHQWNTWLDLFIAADHDLEGKQDVKYHEHAEYDHVDYCVHAW